MNQDHFEQLLSDYVRSQLQPEDHKLFEDYINQHPDLQEQVDAARLVLDLSNPIRMDSLPESLAEEIHDTLSQQFDRDALIQEQPFPGLHVLRKLGQGGMGIVYLAEDTKLNRRVAVKVLPPDLRRDEMRLQRFLTEARAAARLNHPNISTIHSVEEARGHQFITMEHVDGEPLNRLIPTGGLSPEQFFKWFIPMASGLAHAHEERVLHRDLKPANMMISRRGVPKILDFGLARITQESTAISSKAQTQTMPEETDQNQSPTVTEDLSNLRLTQFGQVMGTPAYMSPEQAQGKETDTRSDIFSFGVVMYEALTGQKPFDGDTNLEITSKILQVDPPSITEMNPGVPEVLEGLVARCLTKLPGDRYRDMTEVHEDLVAAQTQQNLPSVVMEDDQPLATETNRWHTVRKWSAAAILLIGLGLTLGIWNPFSKDTGVLVAANVKPSVAVLYFDNIVDDRDSDIWAAGMTEAVITDLAKLGKLEVRSRSQIMPYQGREIDYGQIGEDLHVDAVLEGSIQKLGNQVRITTQLVDSKTGNHLWAERYDRPADEIFAVQDEISHSIAMTLGIKLAAIQEDILTARPTEDPRAFEWASQGIYFYDRKMYEQALTAFDSALVIDPMYTTAHFQKGRTHQALEQYEEAMASFQQALPRSEQFSRTLWEWRPPVQDNPSDLNLERVSWRFAPNRPIAFAFIPDETRARGQIRALDLSQRTEIWSQPVTVRNLHRSSTLVHDNTLYVTPGSPGVSGEQWGEPGIIALDARTGVPIFRRTLPYTTLDERMYTWLPSVQDERPLDDRAAGANFPLPVSVEMNNQTTYYGLDTQTGETRWSARVQSTGSIGIKPILVSEQHLLIPGSQQWMLLNGSDGSVIWDMERAPEQRLFVNQGRLISLFMDGTAVTCMDVTDRTELWTHETEAPIKAMVNLSPNGLLILQQTDGTLTALDTNQRFLGLGRVQWTLEMEEGTYQYRTDTDDPEETSRSFGVARLSRLMVAAQPANRLYAIASTGIITVIEIASGAVTGRTDTGLNNITLKFVGETVIGTATDHIFRIDRDGRWLAWQTRVKDPLTGSYPMYIYNGRLIVAKSDLISTYDLDNGGLQWNYRHGDLLLHFEASDRPDQLFSATGDGLLELNLRQNPEDRIIQEKVVLVSLAKNAAALAQYQEAGNYLTEVVETLDPGYTEAYSAMADLYEKMGDTGKATHAWVNYHTLVPPNGPEEQAAFDWLKEQAGLAWRTGIPYATGIGGVDQRFVFAEGFSVSDEGNVVLTTLNRQSGDPVWQKTFYLARGASHTHLQIAREVLNSNDQNLFVLTQTRTAPDYPTLMSLNKETGETNWQTRVMSVGEGATDFNAGVVRYQDRLFLFGRNNNRQIHVLKVCDTADGAMLWETTRPISESTGRFYGGGLYDRTLPVAYKDSIQFRNIDTGAVQWTYRHATDAALTGRMTILQDNDTPGGKLAFTTTDHRYHAIDLETQEILWSFSGPITRRESGFVFSARHSESMMTDHDGTTGRFVAFTFDTRKPGQARVLWDVTLPAPVDIYSEDDQYFYAKVHAAPERLLKIDRSTGRINAEYPLLWQGFGPQIYENTAYVLEGRHVYAMSLD